MLGYIPKETTLNSYFKVVCQLCSVDCLSYNVFYVNTSTALEGLLTDNKEGIYCKQVYYSLGRTGGLYLRSLVFLKLTPWLEIFCWLQVT